MIAASSIDLREVERLQQQSTNTKTHHYVVMKIDGKEVFKSAKAPCVPTPQWKAEKTVRFTPTSDINFVIYRNSRAFGRLRPVQVAECSARGIDFLDTGVEQQLVDESGKLCLAVKLYLVIESHVEFMKAVKQEVSQLAEVKGADAAQRATTVGAGIGTVLKAMVPVIDNFAGAHPILNGAWIVLSSAYKIAQSQATQDGVVQDLVDSLSEMAGAASSWKEPLEIPGTVNVIDEIGKASLEAAILVHDYVDPSFHGKAKFLARTFTHTLSDMPSRITKSQTLLKGLTEKLKIRVILDTNARMTKLEHRLDKSEVQKWIFTVDSDTSLSYNAAQKVHLSGTGSWFLNGSQFSDWKARPGSVLWLYGGPGSGKTVLSYSAITDIINLCELRPLVRGYAYFFFDARNDKLQDFSHEKFLRSLITQLSDRCGDDIPAALVSMYRACDNGHRQPPLISLEATLLQVLDCFEDVYIVIDSLDECTDKSKSDLLNWIELVTSKASGKLHMMASSRPEKKIAQGLASLPGSSLQKVSVEDLSTESDINTLIDAELAKMGKWNQLERQMIKSIILPRSGKMFRWVALQLYDVSECSSKKELVEKLESLPKDLDETYARIFKRSKHPDVLRNMLQWLAFSQREMTVEELAEVAAVDLSEAERPVYDPEMRYKEPTEVLSICYGLVTEVKGIIKLAHFSVKEYLIKHIQPAPGRTSAQLSHSVIAQICLAQLLYFDKPSIISWSHDITNSRCRINSSFPLSEYAAVHWVSHYHSAGTDAADDPRLLRLLKGLFTLPHSYALNSWVLLRGLKHLSSLDLFFRQLIRRGEISLDEIASPLQYACIIGSTDLVGHLIEAGAEIDEVCQSRTPLLEASEYGHLEVLKLLLEHGADVNIEGGQALQTASYKGHLNIVKLLLERGADVSVGGGKALQEASKWGHLGIAMLLLEHGADVSVEGGQALQGASEYGHIEIVKLLLEHGTDVSVAGGKALQKASGRGHLEITMLLLEHGVDVNFNGADAETDSDCQGTALYIATTQGHLEIAQMLQERGARSEGPVDDNTFRPE